MPRRGVSQDTVAKALRSLEESALQNIHDFGSQGIAITLKGGIAVNSIE